MTAPNDLLTCPPHNLDAERAVLCAMYLDPAACDRAVDSLRSSDFYEGRHGKIFDALLAMRDREDAVDLLTLGEELRKRKEFTEVGGDLYLAEVAAESGSSANVELHAQIVAEKSVARLRLVELQQEAEAIRAGEPVTAVATSRRLLLTRASTIEPKPVRWIWEGRVPAGEITLTPGVGGIGKSTFHTWVIAQLTRGTLPGLHHGTPRACLICATEDSWSHAIIPRLMAAEADLDLVYRVDVVVAGEQLRLTLPKDTEALTRAIIENEVAAVSLDPVVSLIDGQLNSHKDQEVRQALEPIRRVAEITHCAVLGNAHFNKGSSADPVMRITGSAAWSQVVRSVLAFARDDESDCYVITQSKSNLGRLDLPNLAYRIEDTEIATEEGAAHVGRLVFTGESVKSVGDLLRAAGDDNTSTALEGAVEWLGGILTDVGAAGMLKSEVLNFARKEGLTTRTVERAAVALDVVSTRDENTRGQPTSWSLPDYSPSITRQTSLASNHEPNLSEVRGANSGITRQPSDLASNRQNGLEKCGACGRCEWYLDALGNRKCGICHPPPDGVDGILQDSLNGGNLRRVVV